MTSSSSSSSSSCWKNHRQLVCIISLLLFLSSQVTPASSSSPSIGVRINHPSGPGVPSSDLIVSAMGSAGIHHVLLQDPDVKTLRSFLYTNISLLISLNPLNPLIPLISHSTNNSYTLSRRWISTHILPFHPRIHVSAISIGPIITPTNNKKKKNISSPVMIPTLLLLRSIRSACIDLGLPNIPISTVHSFHGGGPPLLRPSSFFPPSSARFQQDLRPLLEFLNSTGSPFLVDLYPFQMYRTNPAAVPIGYVLFLEKLLGKEEEEEDSFFFLEDEVTGLRYRNMFDSMVDALITALEKTGYGRLPLVVTGTGWPTDGPSEYATPKYSFLYNKGLVDHLRFGLGTPMRREGVKAVYIRELFDTTTTKLQPPEEEEEESHWGIWFANLTHKYQIDFSSSSSSSPRRGGLLLLLLLLLFYWSSPCLLLLLWQIHH